MLQVASLKCDVELFSRLYIGCQTREGNLEEFFRHQNQAYPPALSDGHLGTKSDLLASLIDHSECQSDAPVISSIIIDGAVIVQMLNLWLLRILMNMPLRFSFHTFCYSFKYIDNTLKSTARAKCGKETRRRVVSGALVPGNWQDFLRIPILVSCCH